MNGSCFTDAAPDCLRTCKESMFVKIENTCTTAASFGAVVACRTANEALLGEAKRVNARCMSLERTPEVGSTSK